MSDVVEIRSARESDRAVLAILDAAYLEERKSMLPAAFRALERAGAAGPLDAGNPAGSLCRRWGLQPFSHNMRRRISSGEAEA